MELITALAENWRRWMIPLLAIAALVVIGVAVANAAVPSNTRAWRASKAKTIRDCQFRAASLRRKERVGPGGITVVRTEAGCYWTAVRNYCPREFDYRGKPVLRGCLSRFIVEVTKKISPTLGWRWENYCSTRLKWSRLGTKMVWYRWRAPLWHCKDINKTTYVPNGGGAR